MDAPAAGEQNHHQGTIKKTFINWTEFFKPAHHPPPAPPTAQGEPFRLFEFCSFEFVSDFEFRIRISPSQWISLLRIKNSASGTVIA